MESQLIKGRALCQKHAGSKLNGALSAANYQQALVKKLIVNFKYPPYLKNLKQALSYLIIAHLKLSRKEWLLKTGENSIVIAVPQEKAKQKNRGFNPAFLLAQEIARFYQLPLAEEALVKIKKTSPQAKLNRQERLVNLQDCFQVGQPGLIVNKKIFLVDDVLTTGATLEQCARALKQVGASAVWGLILARDIL